jgi:hypothetical protein
MPDGNNPLGVLMWLVGAVVVFLIVYVVEHIH